MPLVVLIVAAVFLHFVSAGPVSLSERLSGKILLQVESNGEAWYVNPKDFKRYYLGRPADAFALMRSVGIGITNENLNKIQVADFDFSGRLDTDGDGLSDAIEDALGSDKNKADTDDDGYNDRTEIVSGFNPSSSAQFDIDSAFAFIHKGKIFLQVEGRGEAWYINPDNNRRYFLGSPDDAFSLMRKLGLGISNSDLTKITSGGVASGSGQIYPEPGNLLNCGISLFHQEKIYRETPQGELVIIDYRKDNAMICMGNAIIDGCQPAKFLRYSSDSTSRTEEIVGSNSTSCFFKIEYGNISKADSPAKPYANSAMICSYQKVLFDNGCDSMSNELCDELEFRNDPGSIYGFTFDTFEKAAMANPGAYNCAGSLVDRLGS